MYFSHIIITVYALYSNQDKISYDNVINDNWLPVQDYKRLLKSKL